MTNTEQKHTPTPWELRSHKSESCNIRSSGGRLLAVVNGYYSDDGEFLESAEANAAFIVRAVNTHDEMLAALKRAKALLLSEADTSISQINDAIAKAEGR